MPLSSVKKKKKKKKEEKKRCFQLFSVTFDKIFIKLSGNEDRHKSSNEFEFGPDRIIISPAIKVWGLYFFFT